MLGKKVHWSQTKSLRVMSPRRLDSEVVADYTDWSMYSS